MDDDRRRMDSPPVNRRYTLEMPIACEGADPIQRSLADAIIRMTPMDEIRILLACGAKVNEPVTQGLRPLHYAVWQRNIPAIHLLIVRGADINATDECGYSALHLAAEHGFLEVTEILLEAGAQTDFRMETGELYPRTTVCDEPLRLALRNKHFEVAKALLEYGADVNKRYFFGAEINLVTEIEAIELLLNYGANTETFDRAGMTPLMRAARHSHEMEQVLLLLSHSANVNAMTDSRNDYRTVLHYAVLSGNLNLVQMLIKQGAKVDQLPPNGEQDRPSPLDLAILRGDPAMVRLLLEKGANVNRASPVIGAPLHVACADNISHRVEILKMLLSYGADPNRKVFCDPDSDQTLRPPLAELLASNKDTTTEELTLLLRHGAKVVMKTQYRDPDGLLNCIANVPAESPVFEKLIEACELFDPCVIRRSLYLSDEQRKILWTRAKVPISLKNQCRVLFRRLYGRTMPANIPSLFVPITLHKYLLYEYDT